LQEPTSRTQLRGQKQWPLLLLPQIPL
jgi:hypothetical protein